MMHKALFFRYKLLFFTLIALLLTACVNRIWKINSNFEPAELPKSGCPDLGGVYHSMPVGEEGVPLANYFLGTALKHASRGGSNEKSGYLSVESNILNQEVFSKNWNPLSDKLVRIQSTGDKIQLYRMLELDKPFVMNTFTPQRNAGCYNNALIIRRAFYGGYAWDSYFSQIEYEIRKLPDGRLQIKEDHEQWTGGVTVSNSKSSKTLIFRPYRKEK